MKKKAGDTSCFDSPIAEATPESLHLEKCAVEVMQSCKIQNFKDVDCKILSITF